MYRGLSIAAVIPCYNEAAKIGKVVQRLRATGICDQILVIDDGSQDSSASIAQSCGAAVLKHAHPNGVGAAIRTGITAVGESAAVIVILAGNNKDEPQELPRLLDPIAEGRAVFVQGSRFRKGGKAGGAMPFYRKIATRVHPFLFSVVAGRWVTDSTNGFRAFSSLLLKDPRIRLGQEWLDGYELEPYLYYQTISLGYAWTEVPVTKIYPPKAEGYTKMRPWIDWWGILKPLFVLRLHPPSK
jgi:dolichol-phosphate mannosyltransferase